MTSKVEKTFSIGENWQTNCEYKEEKRRREERGKFGRIPKESDDFSSAYSRISLHRMQLIYFHEIIPRKCYKFEIWREFWEVFSTLITLNI